MDPEFVSRLRVGILAFFIFCAYAVIAFQLWNVQVMSGNEAKVKVSRQYVRNIRIPAVRGRIVSADGVVLAGNRTSYEAVFHISEMRRPGRQKKTIDHVFSEADRLAKTIGRKVPFDRENILRHINRYPGLPMRIFADLTPKELARAFEIVPPVQGMEIQADSERTYPCGETAGHLIGYVRREDPVSAEDRSSYFYYIPDTVGRAGLEMAYDVWTDSPKPDVPGSDLPVFTGKRPLLRGAPGKKLVIVDNRGFVHETVGAPVPAEDGKDVELTLNYQAQDIAERVISQYSAALVLLDADTGDVIAMASSPGYAPSLFVPSISRNDYNSLLHSPGKPLFNKACLGAYSPGSIIKPLVGIAILENGIPAAHTVFCDGYTDIGSGRIRCWLSSVGHGEVALKEAITVSCNDFFIENGLRLGIDRLSSVYQSAGIGSKTGFILPESAGRLPVRSAKKNWTPFDTALVSIGQGQVLLSPLQAAVYAAALANGGTVYRPNILNKVTDHDGNILFVRKPEARHRLQASPETLEIIQDAMYSAVYSYSGGAKRARNDAIKLCGKTGTAEVGGGEKKHKNTWFIGFGRDERSGKNYAISILVENGASGGKTAAPLAAEFFKEWLKKTGPDQS